MFPLMNPFENDPFYSAGNLIREVNLVPWRQNILDDLIPRVKKGSPTKSLILSYDNETTGLVPAKDPTNFNGQNVRRSKGKLVHLDVHGYPQEADITAAEIDGRMKNGKLVGMEDYVRQLWAKMILRDQNMTEFLLQGMLENTILAVDEAGASYVLEDLVDATGAGPQTIEVDWTSDAVDFSDKIAQAKLQSQQAMGADVGTVANWVLLCVGPAAEGVRQNKNVKKEKFLADFQYAGSDKIVKAPTICENVTVITYAGYLIGGKTALDLDVRGVGEDAVAYGTCYLIPLTPELFDEVCVPPQLFDTINQPGLPRYSWLTPNADEPRASVRLKYWAGRINYCVKPGAIIKIKRPA